MAKTIRWILGGEGTDNVFVWICGRGGADDGHLLNCGRGGKYIAYRARWHR